MRNQGDPDALDAEPITGLDAIAPGIPAHERSGLSPSVPRVPVRLAPAVGDRLSRRELLSGLAAGLLTLGACADDRRGVTESHGVAAEPLQLNVHPLGGGFQRLQLQALRRLGAPWIRVTLGLVTQTDDARPYATATPNLLGLLANFGRGPLDAATWPDLLEAALRRYPGVRRAELLNEPEHFNDLSPARYVRDFLRPGYERIRERFPWVQVVAAAPVGGRRSGSERFQRLTEAGADDFCDYRAVHVYFDDDGAIGAIRRATRRPILVTETGTNVPSEHVRWYTEVIPRIRSALGAELVFWYVLLESAPLAGGRVPYSYVGSSLIAPTPDAAGQPQAARGSGLYPLLTSGRAPASG